MKVEITQQTLDFCEWLNYTLKLQDKHLSKVLDYLDKKYQNDDISIFDIVEYKNFLIEQKRNAINGDFKH